MTMVIMKSISKSKLKSQRLEFLRLVESEAEEIVVTDHSDRRQITVSLLTCIFVPKK